MTLFERIIAREIPADIVHEDDELIAIRDLQPRAPVHILIIPKRVIVRTGDAVPSDAPLLGHMVITAGVIARKLGVVGSGFRLVLNHGPDAGETVPHLHLHLLAGRALGWPPG